MDMMISFAAGVITGILVVLVIDMLVERLV